MQSFADFKAKITAAQGYIELGMFLDANEELEQIDPNQRSHTDVLALREKIYSALQKWDLMQAVAKRLVVMEPENPQWSLSWAYATRRADSIEAARIILVNAVKQNPDVAIFHYNLACYDCQLGNLEQAKARLKRTFELEPKYRAMALEDEDLQAVWDSL